MSSILPAGLRGCLLLALAATAGWGSDTIAFHAPPTVVGESDGSVVVSVRRSGTGVGAVTVNYTTVDGAGFPAVAGSDYTATAGSLTWIDGDLADKYVTIPILGDAVFEHAEYLNLDLSGATGGATIAAPSSLSLQIQDDDVNPAGTIDVVTADPSGRVFVSEGAGSVTLTAVRTGGSTGAVSADFLIPIPLVATAGGDYTAPGSMTLLWADGDVAPKTLVILITDDAIPEVDEDISVGMISTTGASAGASTGLNITIVDDDPPIAGTLSVPSAVFALEGQPSIAVTVSRVGSAVGAVSIDYTTRDFDALDGSDYTGVSGTLNWADGDSTPRVVTVPILDDGVAETNEYFSLDFSNPGGGLLTPTYPIARITIVDDDTAAGVLGMTTDFMEASVDEGGGALVVTVQRRGGSTGAVSVDYDTSDTGATAGADYTAAHGTLNWADGDAAPKSITVPILQDAIPEGQENFSLTLSNETGGAVLDPAGVYLDVAILDDDADPAGSLSLAAAQLAVAESVGSVDFVVHRTGGSTGPVQVWWTLVPHFASDPQDFTGPMSGTLAWADGDAADKTVTVPIVNDAVAEGVESFDFHIGQPTNGATVTGPYTAVCTILDDDAATAGLLSFALATTVVGEAARSVSFSVLRSGGSTGAISVDYATVLGAIHPAEPGVDYLTTSGTLAWADGDAAAKTIAVTIIDDHLLRPTRDFRVVLSAPTGGAIFDTATGAPSADCWIVDDDTAPAGSIGFTAATPSVAENAGTASLTVSRVGGSAGSVTVAYTCVPGTAMAGGDFTAVSGVLSWAAGDATNRTIAVPLLDDAAVEGDETFQVVLSLPTGGAIVLADTATVTITDDDVNAAGTIAFAAATLTISETAGTVLVPVHRSGGSTGAVTATYAIADLTTVAGSDYAVVSGGTLSWADGDATDRTIALTPVNDGIAEGVESLRLTLSAPTGGATLGLAAEVVSIADPAVAVTAAAARGHHHRCGGGFGISGLALVLGLQLLRARGGGSSRGRR